MKKRYVVLIIIFILLTIIYSMLVCQRKTVIMPAEKQIIERAVIKMPDERSSYIIPVESEKTKTGTNYNIMVMKLDSAGNSLWVRTYGGGSYDWADAVIPLKDGGYIIVAKSYTFGEDYDGTYLLQIDARGNSKQVYRFNSDSGSTLNFKLKDGILEAGRAYSESDANYGVNIAKTDDAGDYKWIKTFGNNYLDWGYTAIATKDGHFVTEGDSEDNTKKNNADIFVFERDKDGNYKWSKCFGGNKYDHGYGLSLCKDGGFLISGLTFSYGAGNDDMYVIRTDASGNSLWAKTYGGAGYDRAYDAVETSDNGVMIAGTTLDESCGYKARIIKTDSEGNTIWSREYGTQGDSAAHSIALTDDGGYIVAGATNASWK
jgi:hypothetical protein